ncbi:hypothetical protein OsI_06259 [Oryza sativa Indica Group]|uniref:Uncharacterized protein n=1 Tax=Oryza sativa subsp. indica TaxID=39946 RepID=A2X234_ORYSI|nr:hypothetical protein OsI_06259 [Oryza sativa Indica Group]
MDPINPIKSLFSVKYGSHGSCCHHFKLESRAGGVGVCELACQWAKHALAQASAYVVEDSFASDTEVSDTQVVVDIQAVAVTELDLYGLMESKLQDVAVDVAGSEVDAVVTVREEAMAVAEMEFHGAAVDVTESEVRIVLAVRDEAMAMVVAVPKMEPNGAAVAVTESELDAAMAVAKMELDGATVTVAESELDAAVDVVEMELDGAAVTVLESKLDSVVAAYEVVVDVDAFIEQSRAYFLHNMLEKCCHSENRCNRYK